MFILFVQLFDVCGILLRSENVKYHFGYYYSINMNA